MLLSTAADRIEARDLATSYWHEWAEIDGAYEPSCNRTATARLHYVRSSLAVDFDARLEYVPTPTSSMTDVTCYVLRLTDGRGNALDLTFDPMVSGFEYPTSGDDACDLAEQAAQHEPEPDDCADVDVAGPRPEDPVEAERYDRAERVEEIRNALVGLPVEAKIVALVNALCDCNRILQRRGDTVYVRLPIGDRAVLTVPGR